MIGLLCPGQGSQFVGMGKDLAEAFPAARATFQEADDVLGLALSRICWSGPEDELTRTQNAQPAILVHSAAVWRVLEAERPVAPALAAGHSLGEFSAYFCAGSFDFADAVRTVRRRGELMYEAGTRRPGTMTAVLGLEDAPAAETCTEASARTGATVVPANYNSPGQLVVSGDVEAVRAAEALLTEAGARRVVPLNVSGAFHSPLMEPAVEGLSEALAATNFHELAFPVVSNVTAEAVSGADDARELLLRQLTSPVRWADSVRVMRQANIGAFVEIGPGNVLSGLLRRIDRAASARALGTVEELTAYLR
ncbi:MAG: ACP S-malonyltransferase, partial [Gemmatimonadota bacterium]